MRFWTEKEDELLKKFYPLIGDSVTMEEVMKLFNRTEYSIVARATKLKLKKGSTKENINLDLLNTLTKRIEI